MIGVLVLTHGATGMFLFHVVAAWTSLMTPSKADYFEKFRRQNSPGSIWTGIFMMVILVVSFTIRSTLLGDDLTAYWWLSCLAAVAAGFLYISSLQLAGPILIRRRERLLSVVEGRT